MKKLFFLLPAALLFASCENTWSDEDKGSLHSGCMEDANRWAPDPATAKTYCDCVVEKVMVKYPHVSDALENLDKIAKDSAVQACRAAATLK
ncbi:MAG: hypothetical protein V4649_01745 [Bacteroidota bacterium]